MLLLWFFSCLRRKSPKLGCWVSELCEEAGREEEQDRQRYAHEKQQPLVVVAEVGTAMPSLASSTQPAWSMEASLTPLPKLDRLMVAKGACAAAACACGAAEGPGTGAADATPDAAAVCPDADVRA